MLAANESYDKQIGVNNAQIAATLIGGVTATPQTIDLAIESNPETGDPTNSALLAGVPIQLGFSATGGLYVLQFTYAESGLPGMETDLKFLAYDAGAENWIDALSRNSDGGAGASMFLGTYQAFLAGPGGNALDSADLSKYGIDAANNRAWAVLDHASLFALGVLASATPGDFDLNGVLNGRDFLAWQRGGSPSPLSAADLAAWATRFGSGAGGATFLSHAVPEPTTWLLLLSSAFLGARASSPGRHARYAGSGVRFGKRNRDACAATYRATAR